MPAAHPPQKRRNRPSRQQFTQRLADQFNAEERIWESLKPLRELRRKLRPRMSARARKVLDLLDFARTQPPKDCVGYWRVG